MTTYEVDFYDRTEHDEKRHCDITYNQRTARCTVASEDRIPFALRDQGHTPEKILRVRIVTTTGSVPKLL